MRSCKPRTGTCRTSDSSPMKCEMWWRTFSASRSREEIKGSNDGGITAACGPALSQTRVLSEVEFCCRRTAHPSGVGNGFSADDNRTYTSLAFNIVTSLSLDASRQPYSPRPAMRRLFLGGRAERDPGFAIPRRWGAKTGACERARDCNNGRPTRAYPRCRREGPYSRETVACKGHSRIAGNRVRSLMRRN